MALSVVNKRIKSVAVDELGCIEVPAIAQQFVMHDAMLYKVYAFGTHGIATDRASVPNPELCEGSMHIAERGVGTQPW